MTLRFTKMHGIGNDFMVIDAIHQSISLSAKQIRALAQRDSGVGFDQCLLIEASKNAEIDFFYRIFNANGQEVGQCGNGARCLARFVHHYGLTHKKTISVATCTTTMNLILNENNSVTVDFGLPQFKPADIPFLAPHQAVSYSLPLKDGSSYTIHALSVGNPHAVSLVEDLSKAPVASLGKEISEHPFFPEGVNVGFMQLIDQRCIRLRVYERGCGETKACGSGALAAAAVGRLYHHLAEQIQIELPGGELIVTWPNTAGPISLTGPATFVYEGSLMLDNL